MRNDVGYDSFKCVTGSGILHSGFKAWLSSLASSGVLRTSGASRGGRERSGLTGDVSGSFKKYFSGFSTCFTIRLSYFCHRKQNTFQTKTLPIKKREQCFKILLHKRKSKRIGSYGIFTNVPLELSF